MAFNFNWSPLMADAGFYTRAQDLLTTALNKSPKPPIIVDDIVVTELNLGSIPPELEILEIGDLAEDRFRGIFKMSYSGDAFLTLKTCVQANPLNTYLVTRPSFVSPKPLAADVGLTIPLQITLSEFKLSGFVILVFSKQKGITVVFRNDPLESLKVSSTFDSIPFVRDYLQKEIEAQLRILFMDELPAIIHRLSLRLWVPEYRNHEDQHEHAEANTAPSTEGPAQDPLLNAPLDPVDASGNVLSSADIASLSLDSGVEMHSLFSRKNLLRLATLTDSQRTLSLFTPSIRDVVFRAWTGLGEHEGIVSPGSPALSRTHSQITGFASSFHDNSSVASVNTRSSYTSTGYGPSMTSARHLKAHSSRKRKKRVVDLRKHRKGEDAESISEASTYAETASAPSVIIPSAIPEEPRDDLKTPPGSPESARRPSSVSGRMAIPGSRKVGARNATSHEPRYNAVNQTAPPSYSADKKAADASTQPERDAMPTKGQSTGSGLGPSPNITSLMEMTQNSSILEQAWMMNLAGEIARRIQETKSTADYSHCGHLDDVEHQPPPAYHH
ncbi:hypothetical protein VTO42DRAFT_416 [Malbranchea cinnamomea]